MKQTATNHNLAFRNYLFSKGFEPITVKEYERNYNEYRAWTKVKKVNVRKSNYNTILTYIRHLRERGNKIHKKKGLSISYVNVKLIAVKHYCTFLLESGEIKTNPAVHIKINGISKKEISFKPVTEKEQDEAYKKYVEYQTKNTNGRAKPYTGRNIVIMGFLFYQGLLNQDLKHIKVKDINLNEGTVLLRKTENRSERVLRLEAKQILHLIEYILTRKDEYLFNTATPFTSIIRNQFQIIEHLTGEHYSGNLMRMSRIIIWLKQYNIRQVQYYSGLKKILSIQRYRKFEVTGLREELHKFFPLE